MAITIASAFPLFTDASGDPLDNGYIYIGTANQNPQTNPISVYWDSALTIPASQPIRTSGGYPYRNGTPANLYITGGNYSLTVRDSAGSLVYSSLNVFGYSAFIQSLLDDTSAAAVLTTLGFSAFMQTMIDDADAATARTTLGLGTKSYGTAAGGDVTYIDMNVSFTGNADGTTDFRAYSEELIISGANDVQRGIALHAFTEVRHTAGTVTFAHAIQGHLRLGLNASSTGNVTTARALDYHIANEGSGVITLAEIYHAGDVDLQLGTGTITEIYGFRSGDLGHATRVTGASYAFFAANMTAGAPLEVAYATTMTSGTGRWAAYWSGSAESYFAGRFRINTSELVTSVNGQPFITVSGGGNVGYGGIRATNDSGGSRIALMKTRSTSPSGVTIVQSGDTVGTMSFEATDGVQMRQAAGISAIVDATPGAGDMPGALVFSTTPDGAASPIDRVKIGQGGNVITNASGSNVATNAVTGFLYIPCCAGVPTGVPSVLPTGANAVIWDTTNKKFMVYDGAWLGGTTPGAFT